VNYLSESESECAQLSVTPIMSGSNSHTVDEKASNLFNKFRAFIYKHLRVQSLMHAVKCLQAESVIYDHCTGTVKKK